MTKCPCCGWQEPAKAKPTSKARPLARLAPLHFDSLSPEGRREYYKKCSPADDAYFFASALNRQGYTDRAARVYSIGEQYESGYLNRATVFAQLQIERFGWGRDRTADGRTPAAKRDTDPDRMVAVVRVDTEGRTRIARFRAGQPPVAESTITF